ncbi:MAG: N-acetyl-gamma-glutamyl-phosphate reductase [Candidatus Omnitrophica bacterium]|nr:N-acetyl-gamma-glutamyl-phosphate reductase [Candidatus Omnitrophota bacterium]
MKKTQVAIIGVTGFTGERLANILLSHPQVELSYVTARLIEPKPLAEIFPYLEKKTQLVCENFKEEKALKKAEVFFLSLPHTVSFTIAPFLLKGGKKVIDLSADYRIKDTLLYRKYYQKLHKDRKNLKKAVYGLPEFWRAKIREAYLVANPGCYATAVLLVLLPLLKEGIIKDDFVVIDAKSGVTGAGRRALLDYHFSFISENVRAYKPLTHQHLAEINQQIFSFAHKRAVVKFCPHLLPLNRGIMITVYGKLKGGNSSSRIKKAYFKYYRREPFVRVRDFLPLLRDVYNTNFCDIGFSCDRDSVVIVGVIDNLMKGAASQAVQNMNIMLSLDERTGLI